LTRQQRSELDTTISFLEGVIRRDPQYVEALQLLGDDYTRRGKFQSGLSIDEQLAKLRPDDALVHYNLACSYSLTKRFEDAAASLGRAIDLGYRDFDWLARDTDLKALRGHALYEGIRKKIRQLKIAAG
jgi:Flp pilus assembly protein TadD